MEFYIYLKRIIFFKERYENDENIAKQLKMDLQLWLINYITQDDKVYQKLVQEMFLHKETTPEEKTSNNLWINKLIDKYFKH